MKSHLKEPCEYGYAMWDLRRAVRRLHADNIDPNAFVDLINEQIKLLKEMYPLGMYDITEIERNL